jgi:hypothetical protein
MPSSRDQTRVGRRLTLGEGAESSRRAETSNSRSRRKTSVLRPMISARTARFDDNLGRGTDGSNPLPSSGESSTNLKAKGSTFICRPIPGTGKTKTGADAGFAAAAGHRGHPGQAAQGVIISPAQRLPDLAEQHGQNDPSEPGHGSQDHHVALLALLPRVVLLGRDELGAELVQLVVRCFQLLIDQPDADGQLAAARRQPRMPGFIGERAVSAHCLRHDQGIGSLLPLRALQCIACDDLRTSPASGWPLLPPPTAVGDSLKPRHAPISVLPLAGGQAEEFPRPLEVKMKNSAASHSVWAHCFPPLGLAYPAPAMGSIRLASLFRTFPTRALTGQQVIFSAGYGASKAFSCGGSAGSSPSQAGHAPGFSTTGIRSCSSAPARSASWSRSRNCVPTLLPAIASSPTVRPTPSAPGQPAPPHRAASRPRSSSVLPRLESSAVSTGIAPSLDRVTGASYLNRPPITKAKKITTAAKSNPATAPFRREAPS